MTAEEAIDLYKSRDASEKLFRGDKSYLGNKSFRIQSNESLHAKIFVEFVALIIRNRMHTLLKERMQKYGKQNYLTVPAAVRELEKIEIIRQADKILQSLELIPKPEEPPKRRRGRPKGSKNKPKQVPTESQESAPPIKRKRGRPKGSKNKPKPALPDNQE